MAVLLSTVALAWRVEQNLLSGRVIDAGSGRAEGTSASGVEVAGDLCNGTTIEEGSGVAEGTKSLVPADVDVAGLETGRFGEVQSAICSWYISIVPKIKLAAGP